MAHLDRRVHCWFPAGVLRLRLRQPLVYEISGYIPVHRDRRLGFGGLVTVTVVTLSARLRAAIGKYPQQALSVSVGRRIEVDKKMDAGESVEAISRYYGVRCGTDVVRPLIRLWSVSLPAPKAQRTIDVVDVMSTRSAHIDQAG